MFDAFLKLTLAPLVLRLGLATIFIFHGLQKVNADTDWGSAWDTQRPVEEQLPAAEQLAVAWGELLGGVAMALGFLTRIAALGLIVIMAGAIVTVHGEKGFDLSKGGFEYAFAIIIMCVALILMGPGGLALDRFFRIRPKPLT